MEGCDIDMNTYYINPHCAYGAHCARRLNINVNTHITDSDLSMNSLRRGALQVELLKMDLHPLIGKRPGSYFYQ